MAKKKSWANRHKREIVFYAVCLALLVMGIFYDNQIAGFLAENRIDFLAGIMKAISFLGKWYVVLAFVGIASFFYSRKSFPKLILTIIASGIVVGILKNIVMRARPEIMLNAISYDSFPSAHAAVAFAVLPLLANGKTKTIWLVFAILVAFSRIYLGVHYLTDIAVGMMIGYGVGMMIGLWKK